MGVLNAMCDLWWRRIPAAAQRLSRAVAITLTDGQYICAWPAIGAVAPLLALAAGGALGARLVPSGTPFTASLVTMSILFAIGALGAGLGTWALIGYALGDLLFGTHIALQLTAGSLLAQFVSARIPQLVSYGLLAMLLVGLPLTAQVVRLDTSLRLPLRGRARFLVDASLQALLLGGFAWAWGAAAGPLIRPLYTWVNQLPDVRAIQPLQQHGALLAVVGVAVGAIRVALEEVALRRPDVLERLIDAGAPVAAGVRGPVWRYAGIAASAAAATLLISGVLASVAEGVGVGLAIAAVLLLREIAIPRMRPWAAFAARIPMLLRLAAGLGATYWASQTILNRMYWTTRSFIPMALVVIVSVAAFAVLFPHGSAGDLRAEEASADG